MPTTWPTLDVTKPDATTQTLTQMGQSARDTLTIVRTALAAGTMFGWAETPSGGSEEQPAVMTYAKGVERIRASITWGTTGGATGNPTAILYEYSSDSGSTWAAAGTMNLSWTASGNSGGITWS